jgi:hypothetical protein
MGKIYVAIKKKNESIATIINEANVGCKRWMTEGETCMLLEAGLVSEHVYNTLESLSYFVNP